VIAVLRGWFGRVLLAAAGLVLLAYLVRGAGAERVVRVLFEARSWLPAILALEIVQLTCDVVALHSLLPEPRRIPASTWVRSSAVAYAMMILLPAGRAAGEVARATLVANHVGTAAAATASAKLQGSYLCALAVASGAACAVVCASFGLRTSLGLLLGGNALMMVVFAGSLFAVLWDARVGRWITRLRRRFGATAPVSLQDATARRFPMRAVWVCTAGRTAQLLQYGVLLGAVGGVPSVHGAFVAHGIHLVGATLGDAVPNQLGVVDGTYRTFAPALGFAEDPARALSIAFLAHAAQLALAGVCVVIAALTRRGEPTPEAGAPSFRADAHS
jgi:hypothetical protein